MPSNEKRTSHLDGTGYHEHVQEAAPARDSLGTKIDPGGKLRVDLIPPEWIYMLAAVAQAGLLKGYEEENWKKGIKSRTLLASALRHTLDSIRGHDIDDESGLAAAAHGAWDLLCFAYQHVMYKDDPRYKDNDDRPFKGDGSKYPPMIQDFLDKASRPKGEEAEEEADPYPLSEHMVQNYGGILDQKGSEDSGYYTRRASPDPYPLSDYLPHKFVIESD